MRFAREELADCVSKEIERREDEFSALVKAGKMKPATAAIETAKMRDVLRIIEDVLSYDEGW